MRPWKSTFGAMPESMMATPMPVDPVSVVDVATRGRPRVSRSVLGPVLDIVVVVVVVVWLVTSFTEAPADTIASKETAKPQPRTIPMSKVLKIMRLYEITRLYMTLYDTYHVFHIRAH